MSLNAVSPLGATVKLGKVCKECALILEDRDLPTDLIGLSMREFDVILGIHWLTRFHAIMNCVSKAITFSMPETQSFIFQCNPLSDAFLTTRLVAIEGTNTKTIVA